MRIAITGGTGFLGRYIVRELAAAGHQLRLWHRPTSDRSGLDDAAEQIEWCEGELGDGHAAERLMRSCDAAVHAALWRAGSSFRGGEGDLETFLQRNVIGSIQLIEAARRQGVGRFVYISTCAVHELILEDRPLDETHPLWPTSHYGAHKAAVEKFVHSYGWGEGYPICALRPTGIYGLAHPARESKYFDLVQAVVRGEPVECRGGGKEVHALDVARAVGLLLKAKDISGQAYNCYDRYVSEYDVAQLARQLTGSTSEIRGHSKQPKHQIETDKLRQLGMRFGGRELLEATVKQLVEAARP